MLQVAGDSAFIKIVGSLDFYESDIWAVVESKGVENMVVRCPDFSALQEIRQPTSSMYNMIAALTSPDVVSIKSLLK
jgi:hypothetical protein